MPYLSKRDRPALITMFSEQGPYPAQTRLLDPFKAVLQLLPADHPGRDEIKKLGNTVRQWDLSSPVLTKKFETLVLPYLKAENFCSEREAKRVLECFHDYCQLQKEIYDAIQSDQESAVSLPSAVFSAKHDISSFLEEQWKRLQSPRGIIYRDRPVRQAQPPARARQPIRHATPKYYESQKTQKELLQLFTEADPARPGKRRLLDPISAAMKILPRWHPVRAQLAARATELRRDQTDINAWLNQIIAHDIGIDRFKNNKAAETFYNLYTDYFKLVEDIDYAWTDPRPGQGNHLTEVLLPEFIVHTQPGIIAKQRRKLADMDVFPTLRQVTPRNASVPSDQEASPLVFEKVASSDGKPMNTLQALNYDQCCQEIAKWGKMTDLPLKLDSAVERFDEIAKYQDFWQKSDETWRPAGFMNRLRYRFSSSYRAHAALYRFVVEKGEELSDDDRSRLLRKDAASSIMEDCRRAGLSNLQRRNVISSLRDADFYVAGVDRSVRSIASPADLEKAGYASVPSESAKETVSDLSMKSLINIMASRRLQNDNELMCEASRRIAQLVQQQAGFPQAYWASEATHYSQSGLRYRFSKAYRLQADFYHKMAAATTKERRLKILCQNVLDRIYRACESGFYSDSRKKAVNVALNIDPETAKPNSVLRSPTSQRTGFASLLAETFGPPAEGSSVPGGDAVIVSRDAQGSVRAQTPDQTQARVLARLSASTSTENTDSDDDELDMDTLAAAGRTVRTGPATPTPPTDKHGDKRHQPTPPATPRAGKHDDNNQQSIISPSKH